MNKIKELWEKNWLRYFEIYKVMSIFERILLSIIFSILTGISAQIYIKLPFTPVPVTLQTFVVLLSGILLGKIFGLISQTFYFIGGISGIGWFYGGETGIFRPTIGYLIGFIFASYIAGYFSEKRNKILGMIFASLIIYFFGVLFLKLFFPYKGFKDLLIIGVLPFIPFDILKAIIAGFFAMSIRGRIDEKV
ncbi:MAG: biotin transporter BioY [candidate division WOR-3 bacterium]|nr:biotin transporter BioY [Candidatus Omnitrophota bacterium]